MKLGAVEKLAKCLDAVTGFDIKIESVLLTLNTLTKSAKGKEHCKRTQIHSMLISIIESNTERPECEVFTHICVHRIYFIVIVYSRRCCNIQRT